MNSVPRPSVAGSRRRRRRPRRGCSRLVDDQVADDRGGCESRTVPRLLGVRRAGLGGADSGAGALRAGRPCRPRRTSPGRAPGCCRCRRRSAGPTAAPRPGCRWGSDSPGPSRSRTGRAELKLAACCSAILICLRMNRRSDGFRLKPCPTAASAGDIHGLKRPETTANAAAEATVASGVDAAGTCRERAFPIGSCLHTSENGTRPDGVRIRLPPSAREP